METNILLCTLVFLLCCLECSYSGPVSMYRRRRDTDCKSTAANLDDAVTSVSKAQDVRLDTEMMMKPYANWEEFLMPAPICIAILGELAAISSAGRDFSIKLNAKAGGFKFMKYPDSFAASLMQICNSAWFAFNTANKNMNKIRILSGLIPSANIEIANTLFMSTASVNALLPKKLNSLLQMSKNCFSLAQSVETSFSETIDLIHEVLEACRASQSGYQKNLTDVQTTLEQLSVKEASSRKSLEMTEAFKKAIETQLTDAIDTYKNAMDKVPSVMETVGADILGTFLNPSSFIGNKAVKQELGTGHPDTDDDKSTICTNNVCARSNQMIKIAEIFKNVLDSEQKTINMKKVYDERNHKITTDSDKDWLLVLQKEISDSGNCVKNTQIDNILRSGIAICEDLHTAATSDTVDQKNLKLIAEKIKALCSNSIKVDTQCKQVTGAPPLPPRPPHISAALSGGIGSQSAQMAWARVEQARVQLNNTQTMYMKTFENLINETKMLTEILVKMKSQKLDEIDFDTAKKLLIEGLGSMVKIKEQWEKMTFFFQMISSLIVSCLSKDVNNLVESAKSVQNIPNYSAEDFVKDIIFMQASKAINIGYLVNMISSTYYEVSQRFLMDRVSALGIFLTMKPSNPEFMQERLKLETGCEEAKTAIQNLVISKKQEFDMAIEARVERIKCQLGAAIPPMSAEEKKKISEAVEAGANAVGDSGNNYANMAAFV